MKIINNHNIPEYIITYMEDTQWMPKQGFIRVSELIRSPHMKRLMVENWDSIEVDARKLFMAMVGDGVHTVMEKAIHMPRNFEKYAMLWSEQTMELEIDGVILKGTVDLYYADNELRFVLDDFKTTKVDSIMRGTSDSWELQTNVYAFLLEQYGKRVESINIVAILKDWSFPQSLYSHKYPQSPVLSIPIRKWDRKDATDYVKNRVALHNSVFSMSKEDFLRCSGCHLEDRWHKDDVWACKKEGASRARACFNNKQEAESNIKKGEIIEYRYAEDTYCKHFCVAESVCPWKRI